MFSLAKSQQYDQEGLIDIFTQYGDHLYSKGDHDGAIDQYIKTIGKLEASYVIRKVFKETWGLSVESLCRTAHVDTVWSCFVRNYHCVIGYQVEV